MSGIEGPDGEDVAGLILRGVASARKRAPDALADVTLGGESVLPLAAAGLDGLERMAPALGHLASAQVGAILALLSVGKSDEARRIYLAHGATFDELIAQGYADADALGRATARRAAAWDEIIAIAQEIGITALRLAVPLLLAAL